MIDKERELKASLGRRMANNLVRLMNRLSGASSQLLDFINSGAWKTEDYIMVHDRPFSALSSLAQAEIRVIKELRNLVESGILDSETIKTVYQETEELQTKAVVDDSLNFIIEELKVSLERASKDLTEISETGKNKLKEEEYDS